MVHVKLQYNRIFFVGMYMTALLITCNPIYGYSAELKCAKAYYITLAVFQNIDVLLIVHVSIILVINRLNVKNLVL